ncbi:MAG: Ig-like domain-containing protein [Flavobacteriales bacterium]|nr:Ig-like domain-containing protein [Flavobacteriales bacterium]
MRSKIQIIVLLVGIFSACTNSKKFPVYNPEFINHISAYTTGFVERDAEIIIVLNEAVKDNKKDKIKPTELFDFEPTIKGTAEWRNNRTIVFKPNEKLKRGTVYQAVFHYGEIKNVKRDLKRFPFRFETKKPEINLHVSGLQTYADNNPKLRKLTGEITTSDDENLETIKQCLTAQYKGKSQKIDWYEVGSQKFRFEIDSLERGSEMGKVILELNGKPMECATQLKNEVLVPGMGIFRVETVEIINEPDQKIHVFFSESLSEMQSFIGLVELDSQSIENYEVNGNKMTIFPQKGLIGEHRLKFIKSIKNYAGKTLQNDLIREVYFEKPKPKLRMVGAGTIVPDAKGVVFPFEAMGLKAVDVWIFRIHEQNIPQFLQINDLEENGELKRVGKLIYEGKVELNQNKKPLENEWVRYTLNINKYIQKEPGAIYRVMIGFRRSYTFFECSEGEEDHAIDDDAMYYHYYSGNNYNLINYYPCDNSFYYSGAVARNILASDVGIIAKKGNDGKTHVFVNNLASAQPMANVKVEFFDYQNIKLKSATTDQMGMATVGNTDDAYLVMASSGKQKGYLKISDGRNNSTSKFEVDGVINEGFNGKIYTERGVWRPGDSIYVCFVLEDKNNQLPANVPVSFELSNPHGQVIKKSVKIHSVGSIYDFRTATLASAITGNYSAKVTVGGKSFYRTLAIETVKPNRLKLKIAVLNDVLQRGKENKITITSEWLHGAKSPGLAYNVKARIRPTKTIFEKFKKFNFEDFTKARNTEEVLLSEGNLDENGQVVFAPKMQLNERSNGTLNVDLLTKVFEKGGNFSQDYATYPFMAFDSYAGLEMPETDDDTWLETDKKYVFRIANVSNKGDAIGGSKLEVKVYKIDWRWWWDNNGDATAYMQSNSLMPAIDTVLTTASNGIANVPFKLPYPNWGRFVMVVKDLKSNHTSSSLFYVDYPYWRRTNRNKTDQAKTIELSSNKTVYNTNETVQITIPSSSSGKALVCIENGTSVLKKFWVDGSSGESHFTFKTTKEMAPNVYVHVSYLQSYKNEENDLPMRLYGILPISVEDKNTHLDPVLTVKDEIRPDRKENITVSEKNGKAMTYTLAVVDEGLLDLTHFSTPDLWEYFYQKQALGVKTWDLYDDVMGGYAGKYGNVLSVGGDEAGALDESAHKANRFKPTVKFLGPFHLNPGQSVKHGLQLGEYIGAVRVMVIARQENAYGKAEKSVKVKKPIMVLATMPRVISPGESIEIPATVFAITEGKKQVKVDVKVSNNLTIDGSTTKTIDFAQQGDETVFFKARVAEKVGIAKVEITAKYGNEIATQTIEIEIRTPNPRVTDVQEFALEKGKKLSTQIQLSGIDGTNMAIVEVSALPPLNLNHRLNELLRYPHGCVEQTTSSVFAQLFVNELLSLTENEQVKASQNIQAAIQRLKLFQTNSGGFGYWPGASTENEWGTNYAGHFLVLAKDKGYQVDANFMKNWANYQKDRAISYNSTDESAQLIQAYRLYTLALNGKPEIAAMNRFREMPNLSGTAKWRLAAAYAIAGMPEVAQNLINQVEITPNKYASHGYTYGSELRDKAMILETLTLLNKENQSGMLAKEIAKSLASSSWLSTQETAYSLIAIQKYYRKNNATGEMKFVVNHQNSSDKIATAKPMYSKVLANNAARTTQTLEISNTGSNMLFVRVVKSYVPMQADTTKISNKMSLNVAYFDYEGNRLDPNKIPKGTEFKARITVQNKSYMEQRDLALSFMVPAGWEIQNNRMFGDLEGVDYQDIKDDRIYTYFDLNRDLSKTIEVPLTATYNGTFFQPTISVENMYDHSVLATEPGGWVEVVNKLAAGVN